MLPILRRRRIMTTDLRSSPHPAGWILDAPRAAFGLKALLPVWTILLTASHLASAFPSMRGLVWAAAAGTFPILLPGLAHLSMERGRGNHVTWTEWSNVLGRALPVWVPGVLFVASVPALAIALAWGSSLVGRLPVVGPWLLDVWRFAGGFPLGAFASAWIVVGGPAAVLVLAGSGIELPEPVDVTTRALSYVRRRPLGLALGWLTGLASAVLAGVAFAAFTTCLAVIVEGMALVGAGSRPTTSVLLERIVPAVRAALEAGPLPQGVSMLTHAAVMLLPAFLLAALGCANARVYTWVRLACDGSSLDELPAAPRPGV